MSLIGKTWALVLAGGEGSRLKSLTTDSSGRAVPKQFCSLTGGPSLLQETLRRARSIATPEYTCAIVAAQHRHWWQAPLREIPAENVIVQPRNLGTGNGILLPLLKIADRDPQATLILLPSDHHVEDEAVLDMALHAAQKHVASEPDRLLLLGLEPENADSELGYILPRSPDDGPVRPVTRFIEKPTTAAAHAAIASGALWNVFIIACRVQALLDVFTARLPEIVMEMRGVLAVEPDPHAAAISLADLYARLPTIDFSRHVLEGAEDRLNVLSVPRCGWSDLGTPKRLLLTLHRLERSRRIPSVPGGATAQINLAARLRRETGHAAS